MAKVRRPRGLRGELVADCYVSSLDALAAGSQVILFGPRDRAGSPVQVEQARMHGGDLVLKLAGIQDRAAAEGLRDHEVRIPMAERPPAPDGEYYLADLVGCRMFGADGREIGPVVAWHDYGAAPLLEVESNGKELLVPFTEAVYRDVDLPGRRIVVELPEGLEDL